MARTTPARPRALRVFYVAHKGIRLRVRVLADVQAIDAEYWSLPGRSGMRRAKGFKVHGMFVRAGGGRLTGTIALPVVGANLHEIVPHEVAHAVTAHFGGVSASDDEPAATAIGLLSAAIFSKLKKEFP